MGVIGSKFGAEIFFRDGVNSKLIENLKISKSAKCTKCPGTRFSAQVLLHMHKNRAGFKNHGHFRTRYTYGQGLGRVTDVFL